MSYSVEFTAEALEGIRDAARYIAVTAKAPRNAQAWLRRLWDAIEALEEMPRRCPVDDIQTSALGCETRRLGFGNYLTFLQIDDDQHRVRIVGFLHAARRRDNDEAEER